MTAAQKQSFAVFEKPDPRRAIVRAAIAHAQWSANRVIRPAEYAARTWPADEDVVRITRASTTPATLTSASALMPIATAFLEALVPFSAGAALFTRGINVAFGRAGVINVPDITALAASFVDEILAKPVLQGVSRSAQLKVHKLAAQIVVSTELLEQEAVETVMQASLATAAARGLDAALFSNAAGSTARPPGLLNGLTPVTAATGTTYDNLLADLGALAGAVGAYAGTGDTVFVASPAQAATARLAIQPSYAVLASSVLPAGTVMAIAANALVSAFGAPEFRSSGETAVHMNDAPGTDLMAQTPVSSMWQTASVAIRMDVPTSWALRAPGAVAVMQGVLW